MARPRKAIAARFESHQAIEIAFVACVSALKPVLIKDPGCRLLTIGPPAKFDRCHRLALWSSLRNRGGAGRFGRAESCQGDIQIFGNQ